MLEKKKNGAYYTPSILSDFLVQHIFKEYINTNKIDILEPSCGNGQFVQSLFCKPILSDKNVKIELIDINAQELCKATKICQANKLDNIIINSVNEDFLEYQKECIHKYSLIVGNPPYIKKNYLSEEQILACREIYRAAGLDIDGIKNIWPAFLLSSIRLLAPNGVLCFILPAELLQVNYTKRLRDYILSSFEIMEIFAFNELVFQDIEQDVIVLIGAKEAKNKDKGISFYHVENLQDLKEPLYTHKHSNVHRKTLDKWTNYILSDNELKFIDSLKNKLKRLKDYCNKAEVGIVTAANSYFIVDNNVIAKYCLDEYVRPILSRGRDIQNKIVFNKNDLRKCHKNNRPMNLIAFGNIEQNLLKANAISYIKEGEKIKLHERYKLKKRTNWYYIPSVWASEAFFTKRSHLFPRIIINEAKTYVTDSFYRINAKSGVNIKALTFSFYNTLTLLLCELEGRYYGGGVLELTPNEFKNIAIPYCANISDEQFEDLNKTLDSGVDIDEILDHTDSILLNISPEKNQYLRNIYKKLVNRRLKRRPEIII